MALVRFLKVQAPFNAGETADFDSVTCNRLQFEGLATIVDPVLVYNPTVGAAASAAKTAGSSQAMQLLRSSGLGGKGKG